MDESKVTMVSALSDKTNSSTNTKKKRDSQNIPRGKPKSKRLWKTPKTKFSNIKKTLPRLSLERKQKLREELSRIKEHSNSLKEERKQLIIERHRRRKENAERRLENEKRAEIVQIIKDPSKLKRIKKKQMRMIEKRDTNNIKTV